MPKLDSLGRASYRVTWTNSLFEKPKGYQRGEFFAGRVWTVRRGRKRWAFVLFGNGVLRTVEPRRDGLRRGYSATLDRRWSLLETDRDSRLAWLEDRLGLVFDLDTLTASLLASELLDTFATFNH